MAESTDRYQRLRTLFDEALRKAAAERDSFLTQACASDPTIFPELQRLLEAHKNAESFLEQPAGLPPLAMLDDDDFAGTDRFAVRRRLGAGGMGVVYEAQDLVRDEVVALKTLHHATPAGIYRLKQEFRSLAGVAHPNVVCLYELIVENGRGFFTMELVNGVKFVEYVRGEARTSLSIDRLTSALRQLVDGVSAIHRLGKLHRDIKPSNVLVTPQGRVVILDFGLIAELFPDTLGGAEHIVGGTPAYVAPEEAAGGPPSEAGDWYSVGATLYEALTGEIPFRGPSTEVLLRKRMCDPPRPSEIAPDVPADFDALCMGLMCRDPSQRLSGRDAVSRLGRESNASTPGEADESTADVPFVGRERELDVLEDAYLAVVRGGAAGVSVCGTSGIGKSALVHTFLKRRLRSDDVVVLTGRCYEHESVPYKALDGVVDSLSRYMVSLPAATAETVLPGDVTALPRLFPVLLRVPAVARACQEREPAVSEPFRLRRLAFAALRELLVNIAERRRLIIFIDDLQWADVDGVLLLEELQRPPDAPALLTVVSFRSEEIEGKPFLRKLLDGGERNPWVSLPLEPMPEPEARALVGALLPVDSSAGEARALQIAHEAGGSPFVLEQLARYAAMNRTAPSRGPTFAEMFTTELAALPPDARRFLETLAICGRPMAPDVIWAACGIEQERQSLAVKLRSSHFIRSSGSSERVETYHDRIRDVVAAQISPDVERTIHDRMVKALVERQSDDCEALFEHYRGAGDAHNSSIQAGRAGAKAGSALAFDRAAFFYRQALALAPASSAAGEWTEGLATALANDGRPAESGEVFLRAAAAAGHPRQVELQRRGAEQFLIAGDVDRGLELIHAVLAGMGMKVPHTTPAALASLIWRRTRLRWRGLRFVQRPVEEIDFDALRRIDACWSAATGLLLVDVTAAADFCVRHLLMALEAGDSYRIARGMAMESVARGGYPTDGTRTDRLVRESRALAASVGRPHVVALSILADGILAMSRGEWKRASTLSDRALVILRDRCVGVTWEVNIAQNLVIWALLYQGQLGELSRQVPALLEHARSRGNWYLVTELCTRANFVWLAADDPDEGERVTIDCIERWSQKHVHRQHYSAMLARMQTALYRGHAEAAWRLLPEMESIMSRTQLRRVNVTLVESLYLRARTALAMALATGDSRRFLPVARRAARRIARERRPWSDPLAWLLKAAIAHCENDTPRAVTCLDEAVDRFDAADMHLYAAVARLRRGALRADARGRDLQRRAAQWMAAQHVRNPANMTRMIAPGFPD